MTSDLLMTGGIVVLLLKVTLLLTLSLLWAGVLARASASTRHLLWLTSLSLLLALPIVSSTAPTLRVLPVPAAAADLARSVAPRTTIQPAPVEVTAGVEEPVASFRVELGASEASQPIGGRTLLALLLAAWGAGSALLLGRLALSALTLRRALRRTVPLGGTEWTSPLCEAADRLDLPDIPRLVLSEEAAMPFACGFVTPTIVLPAAAEQWDAARRRAVLFHELAHIRRRDLVGHTVARVVCAIYWIHPMVWTAARRLRAESERACDDLALSVGIRPSEYADHLLQIVTGVRGSRSPAVALPFADRKELEGRVLAILDPVLRRGRPSGANVGALAALLLAGIAFSAVAPADSPAGTDEALEPLADAAHAMSAGSGVSLPMNVTEADPSQEEEIEEEEAKHEEAQRIHEELAEIQKEQIAIERELHEEERGGSFFRRPTQAADLPLLLNALATDPSPVVRRTAAWSLAQVNAAGAASGLTRALLGDADARVRETAAWALASDGSGAGGDALMQALVRDDADEVRATAAWALGSLDRRPAGALPALERALGDRSARVRERAAWAIGTIEPETAPVALYRSLVADPAVGVRRTATWALSEIRDPRATEALLARLDRETEDDVLKAVSRALLLLTPRSPETLTRLLRAEDPDVRAWAVAAAGGAGNPTFPWPWPWPDPRPTP